MDNKPKGKFNKFLVIDTETSGIQKNSDDSAVNIHTKSYCQALSVALIVADSDKLTSLDELYIEIQWDGSSQWDMEAQRIHGMTKEYLMEHGVSRSEAVELIGNFILSHFGPNTAITIAGHNPHFDLCFLRELMRSEDIELRFSNRMIDTNSVGFAVYNTYNSDDLFNLFSAKPRDTHNALLDARSVLKVLNITRMLSTRLMEDK